MSVSSHKCQGRTDDEALDEVGSITAILTFDYFSTCERRLPSQAFKDVLNEEDFEFRKMEKMTRVHLE